MGSPFCWANCLTAEACNPSRPPGLSGAVTTAAISWPFSRRIWRLGTAKSGVPIKTMRMGYGKGGKREGAKFLKVSRNLDAHRNFLVKRADKKVWCYICRLSIEHSI